MNEKQKETIPLKYPIVLVHGIIAHDRIKGFSPSIPHSLNHARASTVAASLHSSIKNFFWGRIPRILTEKGIKVYFGNTDAWGNYISNARILKTTIENVLQETKTDKVNIIAHSKGGIDSRYYIYKYNDKDSVASLSTICTPHHGAELADLIFKQPIIHKKIVKKSLRLFGKIYGDKNPDLYNVNYQLTTAKMKEFNQKTGFDSRVFCQSLYTTIKKSTDHLVFYYSHKYIKNISGENDGVVSASSATWGDNVIAISDRISHSEIIDYKRKKISGIDIPDIYINLVKDLCKRGY